MLLENSGGGEEGAAGVLPGTAGGGPAMGGSERSPGRGVSSAFRDFKSTKDSRLKSVCAWLALQ